MALFSGINQQFSATGCPSGSYDQGDGTCLWGDGSVTDQNGTVLSAGTGGAGAPPSSGGYSMSTGGLVPSGPGVTGVSTAVGTAIGEFLGGPVGALVGAGAGALAPTAASYLFGGGAAAQTRRKHLNRSTYYTRSGRVAKGTKLVTNRRRNAGNAKAVRRAVSRLAMFNHLASKVHREIAKVAPHRRSSTACAPARRKGHREGCRCFACRR